MKHKIFVYGTLKKGFGNNRILAGQEYLGHATTQEPAWQMYSLGGFPGVVRGSKTITGELYSVDDEAFARCDRLEGHPHFYERQSIYVTDSDEKEDVAWMYVYQGNTEGLEPVEGW